MAVAKKITEEALAWLIGAVFLYAGTIKLLRPDLLLADIQSYQLVSYRSAYFASFYLPAIEIIAGAGLLIRWLRREAAWLLFVVTLIFIVALLSAWMRGLDISCGCFGRSESKANYPLLIGRDVLMAVACHIIIYCRNSADSDENSL